MEKPIENALRISKYIAVVISDRNSEKISNKILSNCQQKLELQQEFKKSRIVFEITRNKMAMKFPRNIGIKNFKGFTEGTSRVISGGIPK